MSSWTVITGANRGIGLSLATQLHSRGNRVLAVCRTRSAELEALGVKVVDGIDVSDPSSIQDLSNAIGEDSIDILINNAGVLYRDGLQSLSLENIRHQFEVNSIGPLSVTQGLLRHLKSGSKVAIVSSRMGSIADNTSGGMYGYRMSKAAVNMVGQSLAIDLKKSGISVAVLHPGFVRTEMTGGAGYIEPSEAASGLISRIDELNLENTGSFLHANGTLLPW
jgi:NAD(P)-dependent dehydrogenase (short-subunit alcohol dehydrogenase family)